MDNSMYDELCSECGKSLFMIHHDDQFNCQCANGAGAPVFVYQEDPEVRNKSTQLDDLEIGDSFVFMGRKFTKRSDLGWSLGVSNIVDDEGNPSHLHPTTYITLIH